MNDSSAENRSLALTELIRDEITASGNAISFARFMELALYTPELGYYCSPATKFGPTGDFLTAPEISSLFAYSLARQAQQILANFHGGDILEIGAGSGRFARDLLLALEKMSSLPNHYYIYEKSAALRMQQQQLIKSDCPHLLTRIHWLNSLPMNNKIKGMIIANEVLDALPFHCFQIEDQSINERCVTVNNNHFIWQSVTATADLRQRINLILQECPLPPGYQSEVNLAVDHWIPEVADCLQQGVILLLDYGYGRREYYHPDRMQGTMMCFYQHQQRTNPFQHIGLQDITAHVDFTAVIESAIGANLYLGGYTTQSSFLLACGILDLTNPDNVIDQYQHAQAIKKLTLPSQMGELIKVMALTKNYQDALLGFSLHDRRRNL